MGSGTLARAHADTIVTNQVNRVDSGATPHTADGAGRKTQLARAEKQSRENNVGRGGCGADGGVAGEIDKMAAPRAPRGGGAGGPSCPDGGAGPAGREGLRPRRRDAFCPRRRRSAILTWKATAPLV